MNSLAFLHQTYPFLKEHAQAWQAIQNRWQKGTDFLQTPLAILGGAMTWVSNPKLVAAISEAGGFGVLASGAMPPDMLDQTIQATKDLTQKTFGVNLILMHPQLNDLLAVCRNHQVSHVVFAGGFPTKQQIESVRDFSGQVLAFTPSLAFGKSLLRKGVGALIIEGSEAGGHIGPVSTSVLAQEMLPLMEDHPIFIAGGIGHGAMIKNYLDMGLSGCQMGTYFVCADESPAHPRFKEAFLKASARDAVVSTQLDARFPVIPVRALKNKGMETFLAKQKDVIKRVDSGQITLSEGQLEIEHFWAGALRRAVCEGDIEAGSLMAGQSVGLVNTIKPTQELIAQLLGEMIGISVSY